MTRNERTILDRRSALNPANVQLDIAIGCKDALKRRKAQRSKVLRTKPAILGKIEFVAKVDK